MNPRPLMRPGHAQQQPRRLSLSAIGSGSDDRGAVLVCSVLRKRVVTSFLATSVNSSVTPVFCLALVSNINAPIDAAYCAAAA
mmetsp:Transcript_55476/g.152580  ORF Transcript_55476/g.152580 Transcript_55476/m.152580 type:complete len:83 (+) Transcript_55476:402-650(+)